MYMILGVILLILFMTAIISVTVGIINVNTKPPETRVIYKYMPRSFEEDQNNQPLVSDLFKSMFTDQTPWINSVMTYDRRKQESVNKYYISQI